MQVEYCPISLETIHRQVFRCPGSFRYRDGSDSSRVPEGSAGLRVQEFHEFPIIAEFLFHQVITDALPPPNTIRGQIAVLPAGSDDEDPIA